MSFFHILPSNVAPDTFPKNHAAAYSTPIPNNYYLNGKWEVALMHMTYSGCINTFQDDVMSVEKAIDVKKKLETTNKAQRLKLLSTRTIRDLISEINTKLRGVLKLELYNDGKILFMACSNVKCTCCTFRKFNETI